MNRFYLFKKAYRRFFRPIALGTELLNGGIRVSPPHEPLANLDGPILKAISWLAKNPQPDMATRLRAAELMLFQNEGTQTQVAATLLADLPKSTNWKGVDRYVVTLAKRCSKFYSIKSLKEPNPDKFPQIYRIIRCIAECDTFYDTLEIQDERPLPHMCFDKLYRRWCAIAELMIDKRYYPFKSLALVLIKKINRIIYQIRTYDNGHFAYRITGKAGDVDKFIDEVSNYFCFNELRKTQTELWISQNVFLNPQLVRLMDWIAERWKGVVTISLLPESTLKIIPYRTYTNNERDRVHMINEALQNATLIAPLDTIFDRRILNDDEADLDRLDRIAFNRVRPIESKVKIDPDEESRQNQKKIRSLLPKDAISSLVWHKENPDRDMYWLRFDFALDRDNPESCNIEEIPGRKDILEWISKNLHNTKVMPVYFEEADPDYEGGLYLYGAYLGEVLLDGPQEDLDKFMETWEDSQGKSFDPRWQLFCCLASMFD